jgi:hypothetical protein
MVERDYNMLDEGKLKLSSHCKCGCSFYNYFYTQRNAPKFNEWANFVEKFIIWEHLRINNLEIAWWNKIVVYIT